MKLTILLTTAAVVCTTQAQYYNVTSKPFSLVTRSDDEKYNGTYLYACHEGAAIEGLCVGDKTIGNSSREFHFNTTSFESNDNTTLGQTGLLTWTLVGGNFEVSESMQLSYNPTSNVAMPLFQPSDDEGTLVAFDSKDRLNIQGYMDDSVAPIDTQGPTRAYYRWYICDTYWGYAYTTLTWVMGNGKPQNPTCCPVDVERVFA